MHRQVLNENLSLHARRVTQNFIVEKYRNFAQNYSGLLITGYLMQIVRNVRNQFRVMQVIKTKQLICFCKYAKLERRYCFSQNFLIPGLRAIKPRQYGQAVNKNFMSPFLISLINFVREVKNVRKKHGNFGGQLNNNLLQLGSN